MDAVTSASTEIPLDRAAAGRMWDAYAAAHPDAATVSPDYTVAHFGDSPALADQLLAPVVEGAKRATSSLVVEYVIEKEPLPRVGTHWIACDGHGTPRVILRTTELRLGRFESVDADFAAAEGEDDRTLESWRREHSRYWMRVCTRLGHEWSEDDEIVMERFAVVWPEERAD